jgi:hypothetical protein
MDVAEANEFQRPAEPEWTFQRDGVRLAAEITFRLTTGKALGFGRSSATLTLLLKLRRDRNGGMSVLRIFMLVDMA